MAHPLDGCFAKLKRASEHIDTVKAATDTTSTQQPTTFQTNIEFQQDEGSHWAIFRCTEPPDIPLEWGVLIGDAVHNLRSPLDHLAWQLATFYRKGKVPSRSTKFPICLRKADWEGAATKKALAQIRPDHRTLIDRHQPYKRGDKAEAHPLGMLNGLSNTDKHQVAVPVVSAIADVPTRVVKEIGGVVESIEVNVGVPLEAGAELFRFRMVRAAPQAEMGVEFKFEVYVAFEDRSRVGDTLDAIHAYATGVIEEFVPLI